MIKKIQTYLLENYPLLWNIRILPIGLLILITNLAFFGLSYVITDTTFKGRNYYSSLYEDLWILYFASIVIAIIIFITWLILYFRNNALKVYYPRRTSHVLLEWGITLILCIGITSIPNALQIGSITKWRASTSMQEATEALSTIYKAQQLIPNYLHAYTYHAEGNQSPIPVPEELKKDIKLDSVNLSRYSFEYDKDKIVINGYIGPSLLFYEAKPYNYYYHDYILPELSDEETIRDINEVKLWLQNGDTTKIKTLMNDYMQLIKEHKLEATIDAEEWFKRIYNPPYFPVDTSTIIFRDKGNTSIYWGDKYYATTNISPEDDALFIPEIEDSTLSTGYENIIRHTKNYEDLRIFTLVSLSFALGLSLFVFSCRVTGGKKWLKSLLFMSVFALCTSFFTAMLSWASNGNDTFWGTIIVSLWLLLFVIALSLLIFKIKGKREKTTSNVAMTILLWFIPCILPLLYLLFLIILDYDARDTLKSVFSEENMFWTNLVVSVFAMVPASILVRKWKSLAEE